jgi:hypothetical protein
MSEATDLELFQRVTVITEEYLGPAAERFVARQISFHLSKTPAELTAKDLPTFIEWARITLSLLTEDRDVIDEFTTKLTDLMNEVS